MKTMPGFLTEHELVVHWDAFETRVSSTRGSGLPRLTVERAAAETATSHRVLPDTTGADVRH